MVTIYSTRTCAFCHAAKQYLAGKGVEFEEVKIDEVENGPQKLIEASGQFGVPVIKINNETIIGFNREAIDGALRENKLI